jgi:hypothetical protein
MALATRFLALPIVAAIFSRAIKPLSGNARHPAQINLLDFVKRQVVGFAAAGDGHSEYSERFQSFLSNQYHLDRSLPLVQNKHMMREFCVVTSLLFQRISSE